MKSVISRLSGYTTFFFLPLLFLLRRKLRFYFLLLLGLILAAGCFRKFYGTGTTSQIDPAKIEQLMNARKYFIVHYRDSVLALDSIQISNNLLIGRIKPLMPAHSQQLNPKTDKPNPYPNKSGAEVLSEVHLYVNANAEETGNASTRILLTDVYRMDVYQFDKARTKTSTYLSIGGIVLTFGLITAVAVAAIGASVGPEIATYSGTGCGCPQVYVEQKGNFDFENGVLSGAIYANLERIDYLGLGELQTRDSVIRIRLTGLEDEIQYLNSAQLVGVYHKESTRILADREGKFYSIANAEAPNSATDSFSKDLLPLVNAVDGNSYSFDRYDSLKTFSHVYLNFSNPKESKKVRLLIRAKNSGWAAMLDKEYTYLFGEDYIRFRDQRENGNPQKIENFLLEQGLPLKVYFMDGNKWTFAGYLPLAGTDGYRDMVMELNLPASNVKDVQIRLESVYRFWDLDYAAIDYSEGEPLQPFIVHPASAIGGANKSDDRDKLSKKDNVYVQLHNTESVDINFRIPDATNDAKVSYFLATSGYYHIQKTYPVKADITRLKKFKKPGEFDRFSREKYSEIKQLDEIASRKNNP